VCKTEIEKDAEKEKCDVFIPSGSQKIEPAKNGQE
jgi:hypothetical protein